MVSRKIEQKLMTRDKRADEVEVELYFTAVGHALYDCFGFTEEDILKVWQRADEKISELVGGGREGFLAMKADLKEKANVECSFH